MSKVTVRQNKFEFFNSSEGQYADNLEASPSLPTFVVSLTGSHAHLNKGGTQATYYDGEICEVIPDSGYDISTLAIEGGNTLSFAPFAFAVHRNIRCTATIVQTSALLRQDYSIDMGQGLVALPNLALNIQAIADNEYAVLGNMDLCDVVTVEKLTYDPNTVRNFFVASFTLQLPEGVTFDVNSMQSSVTGTMPAGMSDVPKTLLNSDHIVGNTYTWLFNGKTSDIVIKYTASDNIERTLTIHNQSTLNSEVKQFNNIPLSGLVVGMEDGHYVTSVNVPCEKGWPFNGEYTITPGNNCISGKMVNIFGNGGIAEIHLYSDTDGVTIEATLTYTGTSNYQQQQPATN